MRFRLVFAGLTVLSGCMTPEPLAPVVQDRPTVDASTVARRITRDGAGGFILPDGTRVAEDQAGGFTLPNGTYVAPDGEGGLRLPNGMRCVPEGATGYACP